VSVLNRKARSLGAALLAVALLVGALPTTGITAAAPSPAVGATLLAGATLVTGAGSGVFPSGAVWGGVALSGGSFGQGVAVFGDGTARGDFQMILAGTNVLGVATKILVVGWVTAGAANPDGSASISGTCRVDMQDGTVPSTGVPFTAAVTTGGLQLTVGATALPTLVKSAGWIYLE